MRTRLTPMVVAEPATNPAALAWMRLVPGTPPVERMMVIKRPGDNAKSAVFRLDAVGPGGMDVIAKESSAQGTEIEQTLYCDVLPHLSIDGPRYLGWVRSTDMSKSWLFLEAVGGPHFDRTNGRHSMLAARWLAILHAETAGEAIDADLPSRGSGFYQTLLRATAAGLVDALSNPVLSPQDREVLQQISAQLETLDGRWGRMEEMHSTLPVALMHGDFNGKNMGIASVGGRPNLRVFDWEEAHWGALGVDLWATEAVVYQRALEEHGLARSVQWVDRAKQFGLLLRMLSAVAWDLEYLEFDWVEHAMRNLARYERYLDTAIGCSDWLE